MIIPRVDAVTETGGETRGPLIDRACIGLFIVCVLVVLLRFYTRAVIIKSFGLDDYLMGVALIFASIATATIYVQVEYGLGRHFTDLTIAQSNESLKVRYFFLIVYFIAIWVIKTSILALCWRIGSSFPKYRIVILSLLAFISLHTLSSVVVEIFKCTPISRAWDTELLPKGCIDTGAFNTSQAAVNVVTDIILFFLPMPLVWHLQVQKSQKIALLLVFGIALVPLGASIERLNEITHSSAKPGVSWVEDDVNWTWSYVPLWSQIEITIGMISASLPSLKPLFRNVIHGFGTGSGNSKPSQVGRPGNNSYGLHTLSSGRNGPTFESRAYGGRSKGARSDVRSRNESEESIFHLDGNDEDSKEAKGGNGGGRRDRDIFKTVAVSVDYADGDEERKTSG